MDIRELCEATKLRLPGLEGAVLDMGLGEVIEDEGLEREVLRESDGSLEPWRSQLRRLAKLPNVHCKVSGMLTEADHKAWRAEQFRPYLDTVFEAFGPARLMYGSDWPVCLFAGSYEQAFRLVDDYARGLTDAERAGLLGGNCARFYGAR